MLKFSSNTQLLGSVPLTPATRQSAKTVVVGVPFNGLMQYRGGSYHQTESIRRGCIANVGPDVVDMGDIEDEWGYDVERMSKHLIDNLGSHLFTYPLVLGGDHSIGYPLARLASERMGPMYHLVIDAHHDLWPGDGLTHANWLRLAIEHGWTGGATVFGARSRAHAEHWSHYYEEWNVRLFDPDQSLDMAHRISDMDGWPGDAPCWLSVDLDGIDPAYAPGVNTTEPGGFTSREVFRLIDDLFVHFDIVGADIVEYMPQRDVNGQTAELAGAIMRDIINGFGRKEGKNQWRRK